MSLLFDENLSRRLPFRLADAYPGSRHVVSAGLSNAHDQTVRSYAIANGLAVVSKDRDFFDLAIALGAPPKVVWLGVGNGPTREIETLLRTHSVLVNAFLDDPAAVVLELP